MNAKIDTQGEAYVRALQHLTTGIYLAELCLIGLFSARKSPGPSTLVAVLFICTILFQVLMTRLITPLEHYLPPISHEREQAESEPLLAAAEEGRHNPSFHDAGHALDLPNFLAPLADRITNLMSRTIAHSRAKTATWIRESATSVEPPSYSEEDIRKAYLNPALTSGTPKIWLPRDGNGKSKNEVDENASVGIESTDEAAWVDEKGRVDWDEEDLEKVPIFKKGITY